MLSFPIFLSISQSVAQLPDFVLEISDHGVLGIFVDIDGRLVIDILCVVSIFQGAERFFEVII